MKLCKNGHLQTDNNIYIYEDKKSNKIIKRCKLCRKLSQQKFTESFHKNSRRKPTLEELARASEKLISWQSWQENVV